MTDKNMTGIKIVTDSGDLHTFNDITNLKMNLVDGFLEIKRKKGSFIFSLNRLYYFAAELSGQSQEVRFSAGKVSLAARNGKPPETIHIEDIVHHEWKANHGMFMVVSNTATYGFHLDHVVSYQMEPVHE